MCYMVYNAFHEFPSDSSNVIVPYNIPSGPTKTWPMFLDCIFSPSKIRLVEKKTKTLCMLVLAYSGDPKYGAAKIGPVFHIIISRL